MYEVTVYYDDGAILNFVEITKIGFYDNCHYVTISGEEIAQHAFNLQKTYDFYSKKSSTAISSQHLRCIDINEM